MKRVVGLPGETVQIRDGSVYIDGVFLEEPEEFDKMIDAGIAENELTLAVDEFLCWGITATAVRTAVPAISAA